MLDRYGYTLDNTYIVDSYRYMIWQPGMSEEEETVSALAMAGIAVSAAESGESTIANFEISNQAVRRQGARMVLSLMECSRRIQQCMGMSKPWCDCQRLLRTVKGKITKWCRWRP